MVQKRETQKLILVSLFSFLWLGIFSTLAFAPFSIKPFVWLAPLPLFYWEKRFRGQWKALAWGGIGFSVAFYSCSFHWIYHMVTVFGGFPWFLAIPIFFLSGIFLNLKFPLFLVLFSFLQIKVNRWGAWLAGFSVLFTEFITPQVFPWYWGNVVAENTILAQTAEYASAYGLSVFLFFSSYYLYRWIPFFYKVIRKAILGNQRSKFWNSKPLQHSFAVLFLWHLVFWGGGWFLFQKWSSVTPKAYREVAVVQPDAPLEFRDGRSIRETMEDLMTRIDSLSRKATQGKNIDLLVLPESSVPFFSANETKATLAQGLYWNRFDYFISLLALRHNTNVFFNEIDLKFKGPMVRENRRFYNSNTLYDPSGFRKQSYAKVYLLIFGEYMPFEWMYALSPQTARFAPGESMDLVAYFPQRPRVASLALDSIGWNETYQWNSRDLDLIRLGLRETANKAKENSEEPQTPLGSFLPLICYEVIVPEFVRQFQGDPDFFVNVTNDKWYGNSIETYQHYTLGRLRTIEFRKWMVRSTNSGSSVVVDHLGRPIDGEFTPIETSAFLQKKVAIIPGEMTFYRKYGNLIPWTFLVSSAIFFILYARKTKQK